MNRFVLVLQIGFLLLIPSCTIKSRAPDSNTNQNFTIPEDPEILDYHYHYYEYAVFAKVSSFSIHDTIVFEDGIGRECLLVDAILEHDYFGHFSDSTSITIPIISEYFLNHDGSERVILSEEISSLILNMDTSYFYFPVFIESDVFRYDYAYGDGTFLSRNIQCLKILSTL